MKKKIFSALQFIILLAIGIGLLWLVFRKEDPAEIWKKIISADYRWVGLSLVISLAAYFIRAVRWKMLIDPLGYNPKLSNTFYSLMVGYLANLALPRLGEVSRCGALNRAEKIPFDKLLGTVIVERVIDVFCLLGCLVISAIVQFDLISKFVIVPVQEKLTAIFQSTLIVATGIAALILFCALIFIFRKKISQSKFFIKIKSLGKGVSEGLRSVRKMKNNLLYIFLTIVLWLFYMLTSYVCFFSLESTSHLGLEAGIFILVAGGFGMSAPVQGGIGTFEAIVTAALVLIGIDEKDGSIYAAVVHGSQIIFAIVLGFLSLLLLYFSRRKSLRNENA